MKQICNRALAVLLAGALCVAGALLALADEAKANAGIVGEFAYGESYDQFAVNYTGTHVVTASLLNVRSGPRTSYSVVGKLRRGEYVHVDAIQGDFCRIASGSGVTGYVARQYLDPVTEAATPRPTTAPTSAARRVYAVTASLLNVRTGPGSAYSALCKLKNGARVYKISDVNATWMQVQLTDGRYGYVMSRYMTFVSTGSSTPAPTATRA